MGYEMLAALGFTAALVVAPVGDGPDFSVQDALRAKTSTFVSIDVPWDGSDFEMSAVAEAPPEPEEEEEVLGEGGSASRGDAPLGAVPVDGDTASLLAAIAAMDHSRVQSTPNGAMPADLVCGVPWAPSFSVYCPALEPLSRLNAAYSQTFGKNLSFASAYRPGFEGRSFHGWGMAIDLNGSSGLMSFGDAEYQWMLTNAPAYGWYHPFWAGPGGMNPEAWHWEFGSYYFGNARDFTSAPVVNRPFIIKH